MTALDALARSATSYLLIAFVFALVTATLLIAAEELGVRQTLNRIGVRRWLVKGRRRVDALPKAHGSAQLSEDNGKTLAYLPVSASSYALPYKQLIAVVASLVQADLRSGAPYPVAKGLSLIGEATMADPLRRQRLNVLSDSSDTPEADMLFFAERALDDLQAYLALYTARARYTLSVYAVSLQMLALWLQGTQSAITGPILSSLLLFPTAIIASVLFTPVLREALERLAR